jgi:hypothetical protein
VLDDKVVLLRYQRCTIRRILGGMDERERSEKFTDEELAFLRFAQFGELPPRIHPSEMIETVDTADWEMPRVHRPYDLGPEGPLNAH